MRLEDRVINVALLGLGVVGSGVLSALSLKKDIFRNQFGYKIEVPYVLVNDPNKARELYSQDVTVTREFSEILNDSSIDIVVELIGGENPALAYIRMALEHGKSVVTANKEVMSKHGPELMALASEHGAHLLFEASVGGGIPIVGPLLRDLKGNDITAIRSIINGTTNYILTNMTHKRADYLATLEEAKALGYAESDPTNDVEGIDAVYKLSIMTSLAFKTKVYPTDIYREGISKLTSNDFRYAEELGYVIKLMAIAKKEDGEIEVRVHPTLLPGDTPLAKVDGVFNAIQIDGDLVGQVLFHGQGAGSTATASAVVGDILDVIDDLIRDVKPVPFNNNYEKYAIRSISELITRYYIRVTVGDQPGVMAKLAYILGDRGISIASVIQKEADISLNTAELVITTHPSKEEHLQLALMEMASLDVVKNIGSTIRIESGLSD